MSKNKRHERNRARRRTIQLLYTSEIHQEKPSVLLVSQCTLDEEPFPAYGRMLIEGIEAHQAHIDAELSATSENWSLARMPIVDRSILRLAVFEMIYVDDVPLSVSINEAVELAREFGGADDSPRFVNGVLGRIAKHLEATMPNVSLDGARCAQVLDESCDQNGVSFGEGTPDTLCDDSATDEPDQTLALDRK